MCPYRCSTVSSSSTSLFFISLKIEWKKKTTQFALKQTYKTNSTCLTTPCCIAFLFVPTSLQEAKPTSWTFYFYSSMKTKDFRRNHKVWFYGVGLADRTSHFDEQIQFSTLNNIIVQLHHQKVGNCISVRSV